MKTIGIIGGIGPETTVVYYRLFIAAGHQKLAINSVHADRLVPLALAGDIPAMADFLSVEMDRLAAAGAELGLLAANTPHVCFAELQRRTALPLVSIVEATAAHVVANGWRRLALFGTRMTMEGTYYDDVFARHGLELVRPADDERTFIHDKYMGELFKGQLLPDTHRGLLEVVDAVAARSRIDAVILGGTELSLILTEASHGGIPLIDTTRVHVEAALAAVRN